MTGELTVVAALMAGLVGSSHCVGMCGGIAGALGMSAADTDRPFIRRVLFVSLFSCGRILGYAVIGALAGLLGQGLTESLDIETWAMVLRSATGVLLVAIGLQIAFHLRLLAPIERSGAKLWARLSPLGRFFLPAKRPDQALALGFLWGWLPCGLVYSMVLMAILVGDWPGSAVLMAAFGLGTLPAMTAMGLVSSGAAVRAPGTTLRRLAGIVLILFGIWTAAVPFLSGGDGGHHHHASEAPRIFA